MDGGARDWLEQSWPYTQAVQQSGLSGTPGRLGKVAFGVQLGSGVPMVLVCGGRLKNKKGGSSSRPW